METEQTSALMEANKMLTTLKKRRGWQIALVSLWCVLTIWMILLIHFSKNIAGLVVQTCIVLFYAGMTLYQMKHLRWLNKMVKEVMDMLIKYGG